MAYFVEHSNQAINLDVVEKITFEGDFQSNEYSITFVLPSETVTWEMDKVAFDNIKDIIRNSLLRS